MPAKEFPLSVVINAVDRATAPLKKINDQLNRTFKPFVRLNKSVQGLGEAAGFGKVGSAIGGVTESLGVLGERVAATTLGVAAGAVGMGIAFNRVFIGTAAKFEKFQTILETLEGSSEGAKKSMDWISDFAAKTPYELDEVTDSFVKLRAYGMEPQAGLLRTLGDTSAAMGKPLSQAVEAIADAVTGENERLKEFGIKASVAANKITYTYTQAGKTMTKTANKNSREMIQKTLEGIFNSKYAGSMDKLSKTWGGMVSNISDQWTRFVNMIMQAGPFDFLKDKVGGILDTINAMAASGELQRLATMIGQDIVVALQTLYNVATTELIPAVKQVWGYLKTLHDLFGSWKFLIYGVVAIIGAPLITALAGVTVALVTLGVAMMTTPVGWFVAAVAGIVAVGVILGSAINDVIDAFKNMGGIKATLQPLLDWITATFGFIGRVIDGVGNAIGRAVGKTRGAAAAVPGAPRAQGAPVNVQAASGLLQSRQTNDARVTVDFNNAPAGTRINTSGNAPLNLNLGQRMAY